jgi:ACS family hexuronate transporter-like MFS transporter
MPSRWWIAALLFASTTINYLDRQTLNVLAPSLKTEFHWTNSDFALIVMAFRAAYGLGQLLSGRLLDRVGTRTGLAAAVTAYSGIAILTSLATGLYSFAAFRFLLGSRRIGELARRGEGGGRVVPQAPARMGCRDLRLGFGHRRRSRTRACARSRILVRQLAAGVHRDRRARPRLVFCWLRVYPRTPPPAPDGPVLPALKWGELARSRAAWGIILGRTFSDPVWFFVSDWFAIFLVARGFQLENTIAGFWAPFLAADLGNFAGGGFSSWLIGSCGWPVERSRKFVVILGGLGMTSLAAGGLDYVVLLAGCAVRRRHLQLCRALDDDPYAPHRSIRAARRGHRERYVWGGCGYRHDPHDVHHRSRSGPLLVRTRAHRSQPGAAAGRSVRVVVNQFRPDRKNLMFESAPNLR